MLSAAVREAVPAVALAGSAATVCAAIPGFCIQLDQKMHAVQCSYLHRVGTFQAELGDLLLGLSSHARPESWPASATACSLKLEPFVGHKQGVTANPLSRGPPSPASRQGTQAVRGNSWTLAAC